MFEFRKLVENILREGDKKILNKNGPHYNSSKDEEAVYDLLKKVYPNLQQNYTDDRFVSPITHRHFQADYYDPDSDTFFLLQKHIKHGRRPYNPEDPNCQKDVEWLEGQKGEFYEKMLHTWTEVDPIKRVVAKQQGFKLLEFFNLDEVLNFLKDPTQTYEEYKCAPDTMQYDSDEYFKQKARGRDIYGNDSDPYAA